MTLAAAGFDVGGDEEEEEEAAETEVRVLRDAPGLSASSEPTDA